MEGPVRETDPQRYAEQVRESLLTEGTSLDITHVSDTVYLLGGTKTDTDRSTETVVIIVGAGPQETLEKKHLQLLRKAAQKYDATRQTAHARGGASEEMERLCQRNDIRYLSPAELFDQTEEPSDETERPSPTAQSAAQTVSSDEQTDQHSPPPAQNTGQPSQHQQQREGQPEAPAETRARESGSPLPILGGVIRGGLSYLLSLILVIGMYFREASRDSSSGPDGGYESLSYLSESERTGWEVFTDALGWVHVNAHTIPIRISTPEETATVNMLELLPVENMLAYHLAPAVVLFIFGYGLAHTVAASEARSGFKSGAFLALGYGLFTAIGAVVFRFSAGGVVYKPPLGKTILIAGLVYPLVSGGFGGAVRGAQSQAAARLRERISESTT